MLLYKRVAFYLQALIHSGEFKQQGKLPSERELVAKFSSTRITIREALLRLEADGDIYRRQRKGWFVAPKRLRWNPCVKIDFYALALEQGFTPETQVIALGKLAVKEGEADVTSADFSGRHVTQLIRKRFLDARPIMLEEIHFATDAFPDLTNKNLNTSITQIMRQDYDVVIRSETSSIKVTALPDEYVKALETSNGAACLKIVRRRFDAEGTLIDLNVEYWLHSACELVVSTKS
jgi:DNA-binding GntR family transcriptional regulator